MVHYISLTHRYQVIKFFIFSYQLSAQARSLFHKLEACATKLIEFYPDFQFSTPYSLLPTPYSLLPTPYSVISPLTPAILR
ncbi:hypothetical protein [Moorena sp. SIO4G3]|uniref:hypothetical protein n=1 Tax=Moorena sp. SIO4G3 TaxID=2607821 RepID=UPI00142B9E47|nr:hypothetical protein [Moorena sp. SIO4G3]NEO77369.1 hypothetical protein [Moorena sp. SIO4G3]